MKQRKKVAFALIAGLLLSPVAAQPAAAETTVATQNVKADATYEMYKQYEDIVKKYAYAQTLDYPWNYMLDNDLQIIRMTNADGKNLHYALIDMANDGFPELFIAKVNSAYGGNGYTLYDMYGIENGKVKRLIKDIRGDFRSIYSVMNNGVIRVDGHESAQGGVIGFYSVGTNSGSAVQKQYVAYDFWNGEKYYEGTNDYDIRWRISASEFNRIQAQYQYNNNFPWYPIDNRAPIDQKLAQHKEIAVVVDGRTLALDQAPVVQNNRTLVPLRGIFEALGADVQWLAADRTILSTKNGVSVTLQIDSNIMWVDGRRVQLDVPAQIIAGRTMVPVRAISEALGADVTWSATQKTVTIQSNS